MMLFFLQSQCHFSSPKMNWNSLKVILQIDIFALTHNNQLLEVGNRSAISILLSLIFPALFDLA